MARALAESAGDLNLSGVWRKDKHASDSMDDACDAVQLPWVLRQALNVLTTLEVNAYVVFGGGCSCVYMHMAHHDTSILLCHETHGTNENTIIVMKHMVQMKTHYNTD